MTNDLITNMRERVERCRRVADATIDHRAATALREMANEIEADLERLEAERRAAK